MKLRKELEFVLLHNKLLLTKRAIKLIIIVLFVYSVIYFVTVVRDRPITWPETQTRDVQRLVQPNENTFNMTFAK